MSVPLILLAARLQAAEQAPQIGTSDVDLADATRILSTECEAILQSTGIPSISIALLREDEIVWCEAFGFSNTKLQVLASPDTIYCTGSCFKPITAMAVLQLTDAGHLDLDESW